MNKSLLHPLVLGHRGAPFDAPENTLRSFHLAVGQGADGVELDVRCSADGVPVVIHDDTVDRTTDGSGAVAALPLDVLRMLDAGGGERIPTLAEVAGWAAATGIWLNVEIKATGAEAAAVETLRRAGVLDRTILSSFHPEVVESAGRLDREIRRYLLTEPWNTAVVGLVQRTGADGVCIGNEAVTAHVLAGIAAAGLPVVVWTVDEPRRMRELLRAGVAGIITNVPSLRPLP